MWFPFPSELSPFAGISDIAITHYPNALFLLRSIFEYGQIPLWSPSLFSGYPFAANPLSGLWYPPGWFALLFPLPLGFNLAVLLHLALGLLGAYCMLRDMGRSEHASLLGAIAFAGMPQIFAHYGAGHLTFVYAICWTPWLILTETRRQTGTGGYWLRQPGLVLALILLAHPQWAIFSGALWIAYAFASKPSQRRARGIPLQILFALGLAAPMLLPFIEYTSLSSRAEMVSHEALQYSLPAEHLLGLVVPITGVFHEWVVYAGAAVFIFAVLGLAIGRAGEPKWFWCGVALISVLIALGSALPFSEAVAALPFASWLRVPSRILPLLGFALSILAAYGFDAVLLLGGQAKRTRLIAFALSIGVATICLGVALLSGQALPLIAALSAIMVGVVLLVVAPRLGPPRAEILLLLVVVFDLVFTGRSLVTLRPADQVLSAGADVAAALSEQQPPFRVFSPTQSIPQEIAALYGLELVNGTDPLHLALYDEFIGQAVGRSVIGYSVNVPDSWSSPLELTRLDMLNTRFVVSSVELEQEGLLLLTDMADLYVYELSQPLPRAYMQEKPEEPIQIDWSPNRISLQANGPGRLVLSEIFFPGWTVQIDGRHARLDPYADVLRSVDLDQGQHDVVFTFAPVSVYLGLAFALLAFAYLVRRRVSIDGSALPAKQKEPL